MYHVFNLILSTFWCSTLMHHSIASLGSIMHNLNPICNSIQQVYDIGSGFKVDHVVDFGLFLILKKVPNYGFQDPPFSNSLYRIEIQVL